MISDAAFACLYFLAWQIERHGNRFASRKCKSAAKPDSGEWLDTFQTYTGRALDRLLWQITRDYGFLKVSTQAIEGLHGWLQGHYRIRLLKSIPSPTEVLALQASGIRPVTLISQFPRAYLPVLHKADALAFMLHDLEHAARFFQDATSHRMQRHFFRSMEAALSAGLFEDCLTDPVFSERMDYLISDMNTHPVHSIRFLHAILIEGLLRRRGLEPTQSLEASDRQAILKVLEALSDLWQFDCTARGALMALEDGQFGLEESKALERAFEIPGAE